MATLTTARGESYRISEGGEAYRGEPRTMAELKAEGRMADYYGPTTAENDGWVLVDGDRETGRWADRVNPYLTHEEAAENARRFDEDFNLGAA